MDHFQTRNGELFCEDVSLAEIAAGVGTPVYVYSTATMVNREEPVAAIIQELVDEAAAALESRG